MSGVYSHASFLLCFTLQEINVVPSTPGLAMSPSATSDPLFCAADHVPVTGGLPGAITETP